MAKGIYKRGNVYWIRYAGLDGRVRYESSHSRKFKDAEVLLCNRKAKISEGKEPTLKNKILNHTFTELSEHYLKWAKKQKSFRCKKGFVGQLVKSFGNCPLRRFTKMIVEEYQTKILNGGNAPATANRHIATLKHMFTKAVDWEMVEEEVLKKIRGVKLEREDNKRLRYLSKEECQSLISNCTGHLNAIVITALNTGMRKEEILSLQWDSNVDLKHGFILLNKTKSGKRREIPINQTLSEALQGIVRHLHSKYVFVDKEGKRFKDVKRSFKTALRRTGIKDFKFHDCRHTFASHLIMAGVDLTTVKDLLGNNNITMTLRYAHLAPGHKIKAMEILDNAIGRKPTIQKLYNFKERRCLKAG